MGSRRGPFTCRNSSPCGACGKLALIRTAGERYIECDAREYVGGCGALWTEEEYEEHVADLVGEATEKFNQALAAAAGPPEGVPASEKKSLVTRRRMVEITKEADPIGEGFTLYTILKVVSDLKQEK